MQFMCKFQHKERVPLNTKYAWHQDYLSTQKTCYHWCDAFPHAPIQGWLDDLEIQDLFEQTKWWINIVFTRIKANSKYLKIYYTLNHFLLSHIYCLHLSQLHHLCCNISSRRIIDSESYFGGSWDNLITIHASWLRNIFLSLFLSTWYADSIIQAET
jgi:hypothetical protein